VSPAARLPPRTKGLTALPGGTTPHSDTTRRVRSSSTQRAAEGAGAGHGGGGAGGDGRARAPHVALVESP
jgi:hypothetical protein